MTKKPVFYSAPDQIADAIIARTGGKIVLAMPLGLGKPNHIVNALVKRAVADSAISLKIFTALTLEIPKAKSDIERRFLEPASKRLFGDYPAFDYAELLHKNALPANIQVNEFFMLAGQWLGNREMQQNYIAANYTHALACILQAKVNVVGQLVAARDGDANRAYSLSCNPDLTVDLLKAREEGKADFIFATQVNSELPFMAGDAMVPETELDCVLDGKDTDFELFSAPKEPISTAEQAIGLHAARLVHDGGTLQIGIGNIGDALSKSLMLRHTQNDVFRKIVAAVSPHDTSYPIYDDAPFTAGIYGVSEMFVDGLLQLAKNGIIRRKVDGALVHGGFFVNTRTFYKTLREMPEEERALYQMKSVSFTNQLYGGEMEKRKARVKACFVNDAMMVTMAGAVISDALENQAVISGVGGQYNFAEQAFALEDGRFIIAIKATRFSKGKATSNIVWKYGHETIPWHLRNTIITEYGVAELRGKSDSEVIEALLAIADSRFQPELLAAAKAAGKIRKSYTIPEKFRNNTPERIDSIFAPLQKNGTLPVFPFGTDFTETEQRLLPALDILKKSLSSKMSLIGLLLKGMSAPTREEAVCLERMDLQKPKTPVEYLYKKLIQGALLASR